MQLTDSREIAADVPTVWAAILSPDVLKAAVPGCESLSGNPDDGFEAVVVQKVGPVKARFTGIVRLSERTEQESLTITGEGKGGAAGFAKGGAKVRLSPTATGTLLEYDVTANVGGKLAQLGSRLIDGFARKMADDFFARLAYAIEQPTSAEAASNGTEPGAENTEKKGWFKRLIS